MNERGNDRLLTSLNALMVTDWDDMTDWEGVTEMFPEDEFRDRPLGRDPDTTENEGSYPLTEGETENDSFFDRVYEDSG